MRFAPLRLVEARPGREWRSESQLQPLAALPVAPADQVQTFAKAQTCESIAERLSFSGIAPSVMQVTSGRETEMNNL
jgi:hypothetical protein